MRKVTVGFVTYKNWECSFLARISHVVEDRQRADQHDLAKHDIRRSDQLDEAEEVAKQPPEREQEVLEREAEAAAEAQQPTDEQ